MRLLNPLVPTTFALAVLLASCGGKDNSANDIPADSAHGAAVPDSVAEVIGLTEGLASPEGVRYDPDLDVYFVSNINGAEDGDANGFISKIGPGGEGLMRKFAVGTAAAPLHGPRGMVLTGDTLWVVDARGVHGFHRRSGAALAFVGFSAFGPGFLNDIARGPDGALYVTDTGRPRIFRMAGGRVTVALEVPALGQPNGIAWDAARGRFLLASWAPGPSVLAWTPGTTSLEPVGPAGAGRCDGIELLGERVLYASQLDSSLHVLAGGDDRVVLRLPGEPADIGVDTKRGYIAVPMIERHTVEVWRLPVER